MWTSNFQLAFLIVPTLLSLLLRRIQAVPVDVKADTEEMINPYNYSFILQSAPCTVEDQLLIVVHTSTKSVYNSRRVLMRATWLNKQYLSRHLGFQVKIVFFTGKSLDEKHQRRLEYESELYQDIVQSDFEDNYLHNTYKAMSYLLWTSMYCSEALLLMKIDDDTLVRMEKLNVLKPLLLKWMLSPNLIYTGKAIYNNEPVRNQTSKWYVSREAWPHDKYPLWFQGLVYFLTPRHTGLLFNTSLYTHYMHTDDVFMGILVNKATGVNKTTEALKSFSETEVYLADLKVKWDSPRSIFYHVPDIRAYYKWHTLEVSPIEKSSSKHLPAPKGLFIIFMYIAFGFCLAIVVQSCGCKFIRRPCAIVYHINRL